jgi:hypothetical protein
MLLTTHYATLFALMRQEKKVRTYETYFTYDNIRGGIPSIGQAY